MDSKKKLDSLPPTSDDYWKDAKVDMHLEKFSKVCKHHFVHRTSQEVECQLCNIGYFLDPDSVVKEGHIYRNGKLVI